MTYPMENTSDNDSVFGDDDNVELRQKNDSDALTKRTRRVSDVIDSLGNMSPVNHNFMEAMEDNRRRSDPLKFVPVENYSGSQRHSDGCTPPTRRKSGCDDGYGSCNTINPQVEYSSCTPVKKPVNDTTDARMDPLNDTTDAQPFQDSPSSVVIEAQMPVGSDSSEYNMQHKKRGKAVIFNHDTFTMAGICPRRGSDVDVNYLLKTFGLLGFEVDVKHNLTRAEMRDYVDGLSKEDFSDSDCLCIAVLTHGMGNNFLLANDSAYTFEELWSPFTGDKCLTLAGKPKLFFIQACRGEQLDPGVKLVNSSSRTETDSAPASYKIPSRADFLFAYSSVDGYYSWRNPEDGTWFIQCLCEELQRYADQMEFIKILTRVQRKVAVERESFNDIVPSQHAQKQVPSFVSTLIRDIYFKPK